MKSFLLGILFTYAVHFVLNPYYEYKFNQYFSSECGVENGYSGANRKRFDCVYKQMGLLKPISDFILARPQYVYTKDGRKLMVVH